MNDPLFTRCPGCATVFRVSAAQLALREGQVRCGHCRAVFDANEQRVALDASPTDDLGVPDELAAGRPTVTLRNADALQPVPPRSVPSDAIAATQALGSANANEAVAGAPGSTSPKPLATPAPGPANGQVAATGASASAHAKARAAETPQSADANIGAAERPMPAGKPARPSPASPAPQQAAAEISQSDDDADLRTDRFQWKPRKPLRERPRALYSLALVLLVAALVAQAVLEYRDALAAHAPFTRPVLEGICAIVGCTVGPVREAGALSIDASDLQADAAHRGLLKLTATLRNRAPYPIAWPYLELTLTDASDQVVARRAFSPSEYGGAASDATRGLAGNGEELITLFLDASETSQAGYRVYLFYP